MDVLNFLGLLFIVLLFLIIGMIVGNFLKTKGIENSGYEIRFNPNATYRKYTIIDLYQEPSSEEEDLYTSIFRK